MWQRLWISRYNLIDSHVNACNFHRHPLPHLSKIELKVMKPFSVRQNTHLHAIDLAVPQTHTPQLQQTFIRMSNGLHFVAYEYASRFQKNSIRTLSSFRFARCPARNEFNDLSAYFVKLSRHNRVHKIHRQWTKCMHDDDWQVHYTWHKTSEIDWKQMQCKSTSTWRVPTNAMEIKTHNHFGEAFSLKGKQHDIRGITMRLSYA